MRRVVTLTVALVLTLLLAACGSDTSEKTSTPPTTGASPRPALVGQWKYQSVRTPKKKKVRLTSTNAWLSLHADGRAQGQDGLPWQGTYELGDGWIALKATQRATRAPGDASRAERLAAEVTTKLLEAGPVEVTGPKKGRLRLSVDGYVLTLTVWN